MEVLKEQVQELERRVSKLETYRESDIKMINEHNTNLATIILKLENITKSLETVTNNFKEAIDKSNTRNEEERGNINKRISTLETKFENLNTKFEKETKSLENTIDERTVNKNSDNYDKIKATIISVIVTAIVTALITALFTISKGG